MTTTALVRQRVAVLGLGKIGSILLQGLLKAGLTPGNARATVRHAERASRLSDQLGLAVGTDNRAAVRGADLILISVKPQNVGELLEQIRPDVTPATLVVSAAASVPTGFIEGHLDAGVPVVRAMPNTPCQVGAGMTGLCRGKHATDAHLDAARQLFDTVGRTVVVDEKHMDAVTGLSASGPAFIYVILESLAEAGVKIGLPRDVSTLLSAQTLLGAAKVALETGDHPALLKDAVTTPAGCTIDGLLELEEGKLHITLIKTIIQTNQQTKKLIFKK